MFLLFIFFLIHFSKVRRKISRSENREFDHRYIILSWIEHARFVFHLYFAWFSMKGERSQDLKIPKNSSNSRWREGKRKDARSGRLFEDDRVLARRVVAEIREIELSEGERRGKDQDRGERSRGSKGACPWSEGPGHVPSPTRCMFCNLIMDLLVPVLAPLRLF